MTPMRMPVVPPSAGEVRALLTYAVLAGVVLIAFGVLRLRLRTPVDSLYSGRSIAFTYSLMIALGGLLIALAVGWRWMR